MFLLAAGVSLFRFIDRPTLRKHWYRWCCIGALSLDVSLEIRCVLARWIDSELQPLGVWLPAGPTSVYRLSIQLGAVHRQMNIHNKPLPAND